MGQDLGDLEGLLARGLGLAVLVGAMFAVPGRRGSETVAIIENELLKRS